MNNAIPAPLARFSNDCVDVVVYTATERVVLARFAASDEDTARLFARAMGCAMLVMSWAQVRADRFRPNPYAARVAS